MAESNNDLGASFMDNFSCKICLEILDDPVQCRHNEHYFCRKCITKHLVENSETCPLCVDELTLETLRAVPRIVLDVISQIKKPRCRHAARGCTENVAVAEVLFHQETCGFAPVVCSNEGCRETVNRCDKESHEAEECKFRKITCESCSEEMLHGDYEKHQCTLRREMNEVKARLDEITESLKQVVVTQTKVLENLTAHDKSIKVLQDPLRHASSTTIRRGETVVINGQIFIFGGYGKQTEKSVEVFNWSTKTWTLVKNCLFFLCTNSFSFLYGKKIMLCSGGRIEFFDPNVSGVTSTVFPATLQSGNNGVLLGDRVITFGFEVKATSLEKPWESTVLIKSVSLMNEQRGDHSNCALECIGNDIFIIGFKGNNVEQLNTTSSVLTTLTTLPYQVYNMTTVVYKDNIIILGGRNSTGSTWSPFNDVLMYNTNSHECKRLPAMLEKRGSCAAVIIGDVIVVMGGFSRTSNGNITCLNTVEYYMFGENTWKKLPAMNLKRSSPTACVYV